MIELKFLFSTATIEKSSFVFSYFAKIELNYTLNTDSNDLF